MLSLTEAKRLHRELWFWLELNPNKLKCSWPGWEWYKKIITIDHNIFNACFACLVSFNNKNRCCGRNYSIHSCAGCSEYYYYLHGTTKEEMSYFASIIRNLSWSDEVKDG